MAHRHYPVVSSDCLDATDPKQLELKPCDSTSAKQKFAFTKATGVLTLASDTTQCVDINMWTGPKVWLYHCHAGAPNEVRRFWLKMWRIVANCGELWPICDCKFGVF